MRKTITKAAPVVRTLLGLFGVPEPVLSAVDLAGEVAGFTRDQALVVRSFAERAAASLEEYCQGEFRQVGEADKEALVGQLDGALGRCQGDGSLLIAGVEGVTQVRALLVDEPVERFLAQWTEPWADQRVFFDGLLGRVSVLCRAWVRDPDVAQLATLESVGAVLGRLVDLSAKIDRLPAETAAAVRDLLADKAQVAPRLVEVGAAPPIPAGFQPRQQDRDRLDAAWHRTPGAAGSRGLVQLLTGDGGVGKTQLAGHLFRSSTATVKAWIPATSLDTVIAGYATTARALALPGADASDPETVAGLLLDWWRGPGRDVDWLVVLDDIDVTPQQLGPWWPPSDGPHDTGMHRLIGTLRRRDLYAAPDRIRVDLDVYSPEDAVAYLTARLHPELGHSLPRHALEGAGDLAEALLRNPVALAQAASVIVADIDATHWTCRSYLNAYQDQTRALDDLFPPDAVLEPGQRTVTATWTIAIDRAARDVPAARPAAELAAFTDPTGAPETLWHTPAAIGYLTQHTTTDGTDDQVMAGRALRALARYSLITLTPDDGPRAVRVHDLAQRATRTTIPDHDPACHTLATALLQIWPDPERDPDLGTVLRANTETLRRHWPAVLNEDHERVLFRAGQSLGESGAVTAAVLYHQQLLPDFVRVLGPDHPVTLATRGNLAHWRGEAGDPSGAAAAFEEVLADCVRVLGPDHRHTLTTRGNLAHWRGQAGDPAGPAAFEEVLADRVRVLGPDHPDTLTIRGNLAGWRGEAGDPAGAAAAFEEVLADRVRVLGPDHPDTLGTRHNLAHWRGQAGDPVGAAAAFEEVLADCVRVLGPDHPHTLTIRGNLAHWRGQAGDPAGPAALEEVLADCVRVLGPDHPHTLAARHNLAHWRGQAGDPVGAAAAFEELLADRVRVLGPDHPDTLATRGNLAHWRGEAGDPVGAAAAFEEVLADCVRVLGPDHPVTLATRHNLAHWRGEAGDPAGPAALEEVLADCVRVLGPDHPHTLTIRGNLAHWRGEAGDAAGAAAAFEELLADQLRVLGPDHPDTLATRHNLAGWKGEAGDPAGAAAAFEELLADQLRVLGADHPDTLTTRGNLAYWRGEAGPPVTT